MRNPNISRCCSMAEVAAIKRFLVVVIPVIPSESSSW